MVSYIGISTDTFSTNTIVYFLALIIILLLTYLVYKNHFAGEDKQRLWTIPNLPSNKEFQVFTTDAIGDRSEMFIIGKQGNDKFKSIYDSPTEDQKVKGDALNFFKKQFGLSDTFLSTFMYPITVNPNIGYHLRYSQTVPGYQGKIKDGGYTCFVPKGHTMFGSYGGSGGVTLDRPGILAYGHYIVGDKFRIRYWSMCPLKTYTSFDADYTPLDYDIEIERAPEGNLIGLKGKAQGLYTKMRLIPDQTQPLKKDHLTIRNVLTFN